MLWFMFSGRWRQNPFIQFLRDHEDDLGDGEDDLGDGEEVDG